MEKKWNVSPKYYNYLIAHDWPPELLQITYDDVGLKEKAKMVLHKFLVFTGLGGRGQWEM